MTLTKILQFCEKSGFVSKLPNVIGPLNINNAEGAMAIGPIGSLLLENLKLEWRHSVLNTKDLLVLHSRQEFKNTYNFVKNISLHKLPFGISDVVQKYEETHYFKNNDYLRCTVFVAPTEATQFLYQWQRQRRVWWRKFSATPGRYFTTDIENVADNVQKVEVQAKYPWGTQTLETLTLSSELHPLLSEEEQKNKFDRKNVHSHYLTSLVSVPVMYLNTICDAFEELPFLDGTRTFFRFHRKLAPYKISFSIPNSIKGSTNTELEDLALYLCKKLRLNNVSTLLLPSFNRTTLKEQFVQYDNYGVPYTIVLNEQSLKNGIVNLRSRDTTLSEEVHVTQLPGYVDLLFKNY